VRKNHYIVYWNFDIGGYTLISGVLMYGKKTGSFMARVPLALVLFVLGDGLTAFYSSIQSTYPFTMAFGNVSMLIGLVFLAAGWVMHLKNDGVRFFSHRNRGQEKPPESWAERTQGVGAPPAAPYPIPPDGMSPQSPEYERLAQAELELRRRMMGTSDPYDETLGEIPNQDLRDVKVPDQESRAKKAHAGPVGSLVLAGILLFVVGLVFQYLVPVTY